MNTVKTHHPEVTTIEGLVRALSYHPENYLFVADINPTPYTREFHDTLGENLDSRAVDPEVCAQAILDGHVSNLIGQKTLYRLSDTLPSELELVRVQAQLGQKTPQCP